MLTVIHVDWHYRTWSMISIQTVLPPMSAVLWTVVTALAMPRDMYGCCLNSIWFNISTAYYNTASPPGLSYSVWKSCGIETPGVCESSLSLRGTAMSIMRKSHVAILIMTVTIVCLMCHIYMQDNVIWVHCMSTSIISLHVNGTYYFFFVLPIAVSIIGVYVYMCTIYNNRWSPWHARSVHKIGIRRDWPTRDYKICLHYFCTALVGMHMLLINWLASKIVPL